MMLEIRWHARGGQGAITVAEILAAVALRQDLYVQSFPEYGPERSGAPLHAYNRISDEPIKLHSGVYEPDIVAVLDPTLLHAEPVAEGLKAEGLLLVNTADPAREIARRTGFGGRVLAIPAVQLAQQAKIRFPNVPMLGALLRLLSFPLEAGQEEFQAVFREKLSPAVLAANLEALRLGYEAVSAESVVDMKRGVIAS